MAASRQGKSPPPKELSHVDERGRAGRAHGAAAAPIVGRDGGIVGVGVGFLTARVAIAEATVRMKPATLALIRTGKVAKGEVLAVARVAGIMAAKRTSDLIPLCHPLPLSVVNVDFQPRGRDRLRIEATAKVSGKTGVEMEALTAVSVAALTVYDMCKAVDRGMTVTDVGLVEKRGGKSGHWRRSGRQSAEEMGGRGKGEKG